MRGVVISLALAASASAFTLPTRWVVTKPTPTLERAAAASRLSRRAAVVRAAAEETAAAATADAAEETPAAPIDGAGGTVLVSGVLGPAASASDQFVFDLLHKTGAFSKIVAFSADSVDAKKRMLSRSARYSGLTAVLDFKEGVGGVGADALDGVDVWLSFGVPPGAGAEAAAAAARAAGVKRVVLVVEGGAGAAPDLTAAARALEGSDTAFTFFQVSGVAEGKEGGAVAVGPADGTGAALAAEPPFPRDELARFATEALLLPPARNKAYALADASGSDVAKAYQRSLRATGYGRTEELGFLLTGGFQAFEEEAAAKAAEAARLEEEERLGAVETPETLAKRAEERRLLAQRFETEMKAEMEKQIVAKAALECEVGFAAQRYAKEPVESPYGGFITKDFGITVLATYSKRNLAAYEAKMRELAEWDDFRALRVPTLEDIERSKIIERSYELMRQEMELKEKSVERWVDAIKFVHEGTTYLKVLKLGVEIVLNEEGETILGTWDEAAQAITPYDPDKDEELTEIIEGYDPDSEFKWLYKGTMYLKVEKDGKEILFNERGTKVVGVYNAKEDRIDPFTAEAAPPTAPTPAAASGDAAEKDE